MCRPWQARAEQRGSEPCRAAVVSPLRGQIGRSDTNDGAKQSTKTLYFAATRLGLLSHRILKKF